MVTVWTPLSLKTSKKMTDRLTMLPVTFGTQSAAASSPVCGLPCLCFFLDTIFD